MDRAVPTTHRWRRTADHARVRRSLATQLRKRTMSVYAMMPPTSYCGTSRGGAGLSPRRCQRGTAGDLASALLTAGNRSVNLGEPRRGLGSPTVCRPWRPYDVLVTAGSGCNDAAASGVSGGGRDAAEATEDDPQQRQMRLEAVLLVAKSPLSTRKLAQLALLADGTEARTLIRRLNQLYDDLGRAVRIEHVAGGYRMLTRAAYAPWLARLAHLPSAIRLSSPMMETLAVVAYRGPVSRADIEAIRGVACGELLRQLMERDLIRISGRSEELGRPYLYDTTKQFLQLFGLPSVDALPPIQWDRLQDDEEQEDEEVDPEHSI